MMAAALTEEEIELVERAFAMARAEELFAHPALFYEKLFDRDPALRAVFRRDIGDQGMQFMRTLWTIVQALRSPAALHDVLAPLARTHASLGVLAAQFRTMGEALIDTFRELLEDDFTPEMEAAWRRAYAHIAEAMIEVGRIG